MSMRKIKRRHYRLLAIAHRFDWGMSGIMGVQYKYVAGATRDMADFVDAGGLLVAGHPLFHELATAGQTMYFTEAGDPGSYEVNIRLPPWYTQKGALE